MEDILIQNPIKLIQKDIKENKAPPNFLEDIFSKELWKHPYFYPKCFLSPEVLLINKNQKVIKLKYETQGEQEIKINDSINAITSNNYVISVRKIVKKIFKIKSLNIV